jgi:hypothetical protein
MQSPIFRHFRVGGLLVWPAHTVHYLPVGGNWGAVMLLCCSLTPQCYFLFPMSTLIRMHGCMTESGLRLVEASSVNAGKTPNQWAA